MNAISGSDRRLVRVAERSLYVDAGEGMEIRWTGACG